MSTALAQIAPDILAQARDIACIEQLAKKLFASSMKPKHVKSEADMYFILACGRDLGLSTTAALQHIYPMGGKPTIDAHGMVALAKAHPDCEYWYTVESTAERCEIATKRRSSPHEERSVWTFAEADSVQIYDNEKQRWRQLTDSPTWKSYRPDMLHARAAGRLARRVYADRLLGLYVKEELEGSLEPEQAQQIAAAFAVPAHATTQPVPEHKQIESTAAPLILTPDAEPAKVEARAPEAEAPRASAADDLTTKVNRIGKLVHPFMPDEMRPAELRAAIRKFSTDDIADILTQCEAATRDPDEGDALLRALAGDILRGPADA